MPGAGFEGRADRSRHRTVTSGTTPRVRAAIVAIAPTVPFAALTYHPPFPDANLRDNGEGRWSVLALPFIVMGSTLFTMLPAMEFAPLAAARTGGDVQAAQAALQPWFVPILATGAISFAIGVLGFARGITRSGMLGRRLTWLVTTALVMMAAARFILFTAAQLYVQGTAGIAALWPLAQRTATPTQPRPAGQPQPMPAT